MSNRDVTARDALTRLGASTGEAIAQVLEMFAPGMVERGDVSVVADGASPFGSVTRGSVSASVSYVDGVTGANIFVLSPAGARKLANTMGAPPPSEDEGGEDAPLSELELSAIAEASNQMMAAAASAIGVVLGHEIEISPPEMRQIDDLTEEAEHYGSSPHATSTTFMICGESCRLIQLVPSAFVVRLVRALDEISAEQSYAGDDIDNAGGALSDGAESIGLEDALGQIKLRVWAELGRSKLPLGRALGLPLGAVVELDQTADAPVDLYVNGMRFAAGRLIVTDDGEWAFRLDELSGHSAATPVLASPTTSPEKEGAVT